MKRLAIVVVFQEGVDHARASSVLAKMKAVGLADARESSSEVNEYDDMRHLNAGKPVCGPVFYIP